MHADQPVDQSTAGTEELRKEIDRLRGSFTRCKKAERELQAANRALKTLSRCIEAMTHAADERRLLDDICHIVTDIGGYRMAWIGFAENNENKTVRPVARSGYEEGYLEKISVTWSETDPHGRGPTGTAIRTGKPCIIKDVATDPRFEPWRAEALKRRFKSVLGLPLCRRGSVYGALTIYSDQPDAYDTEEVALLSELASELAYGIMALRDRSERASAERELVKSKAILSRAQVIAHLGNWAWSFKTNDMTWSDEIFKIFGYPPREFSPTYEWLMSKALPEDRKLISSSLEAAVREDRLFNIDFRVLAPDGTLRHINMVADRIKRDKAGNPEWMYGIIQDITGRKQIENDLQDAKAQAELYLDLMGHDINNMNQTAIGFLEIALEKLRSGGRLEAGDETLIARPVEALANSSALIRNVRNLQREHSGELSSRVLDVNKVLEQVCEEFRKVPGRDIEIDFRRASECNVLANDLLKEVYANIVGNSVKHSAGPLTIRIRHYCAERQGKKTCVVTIEDNGPGIPDALKSRLFPGPLVAPRKGAGRGLGLYIVKTLAADYGGTVRVEDRVPGNYSQGCRFIVELPAINT
jgi:PAS domain S-box-containing protein